MADFFISYSSKDKDLADKVLDTIESKGYTCWIAPRNIPYGTPYARAIMNGIDECETFIVLITENSIASEDVLNEVDNAHASRKKIIPIRFIDKPLPRELNYYLSRTQWLTLSPSAISTLPTLLNLTPKTKKTEDKVEIPNPETEVKEQGTDEAKPDLEANQPKTTNKSQLFLKVIAALSVIWMIVSWIFGQPNDITIAVCLIVFIFFLILTIIGFCKPEILKSSKKDIAIYGGISTIALFLSMIGYADKNVTSDERANVIVANTLESDTTLNDNISTIGKEVSAEDAKILEDLRKEGDEAFENKNYKEALNFYQQMADRGNGYGYLMLAKIYVSGLGLKQDTKKAFEYFSLAADKGLLEGLNGMGICYLYGRGTNKDYENAAECFRRAAEAGLSDAQENLAYCYVYGNGVEQNYPTAMTWYEKAAAQNNARAAYNIGKMYYYGQPGIEQSFKKAFEWYSLAAKLGNSDAQNGVGICYLKGQGIERDPNMAFEWFTKTAEHNNPTGLYNLANCYRDGTGCEKNRAKAKELYKKAIKLGSTDAKIQLNKLGK
ncbi:MAG: toll/interleukin-1 receptor domain-containing protein [Lachnoclostridium sp.]|nr:toll/interleukin-1 receptor domain-containing protein [Lachnoclostridium sp.]